MVRNIDLPECIIFYGRKALRSDDDGFDSLVSECRETGTALVLIDDDTQAPAPKSDSDIHVFPAQQPPPSPHDILRALEGLTVQPRAFGGSAGFGRAQHVEPPRPPLPVRTVVFCNAHEATQAGRAAGSRVISFSGTDNLADAVLDDLDDLWLDDIATPGSFWLNPPVPKDDNGDKVDPEDLIASYLQNESSQKVENKVSSVQSEESELVEELDDDELQQILGDIAPL